MIRIEVRMNVDLHAASLLDTYPASACRSQKQGTRVARYHGLP
jgi:hypothetical protein